MSWLVELLASLLAKVGLQWLENHRAKSKIQDIANAPINDEEEARDLLR